MRLESTKIRTQDLFEASYLMSQGIELNKLEVKKSSKGKTAFFIFNSQQAKEESNRFKAGQASANVCVLKVSMNHLKDLLFKRLRDLEKGNRRYVRFNEG